MEPAISMKNDDLQSGGYQRAAGPMPNFGEKNLLQQPPQLETKKLRSLGRQPSKDLKSSATGAFAPDAGSPTQINNYKSQVVVTLPTSSERVTSQQMKGDKFKEKVEILRSITPGVSQQSPARQQARQLLAKTSSQPPTTLKQQIKARRYLIKHNIVKKRENFYGTIKQNKIIEASGCEQPQQQHQIASLAKFLRKINQDDNYSVSPAATRLRQPQPSMTAQVFYGAHSRHLQTKVSNSIPPGNNFSAAVRTVTNVHPPQVLKKRRKSSGLKCQAQIASSTNNNMFPKKPPLNLMQRHPFLNLAARKQQVGNEIESGPLIPRAPQSTSLMAALPIGKLGDTDESPSAEASQNNSLNLLQKNHQGQKDIQTKKKQLFKMGSRKSSKTQALQPFTITATNRSQTPATNVATSQQYRPINRKQLYDSSSTSRAAVQPQHYQVQYRTQNVLKTPGSTSSAVIPVAVTTISGDKKQTMGNVHEKQRRSVFGASHRETTDEPAELVCQGLLEELRQLPDENRPNDWLVPTMVHQKGLKNSIHQGKVSFMHTAALYDSLTKPSGVSIGSSQPQATASAAMFHQSNESLDDSVNQQPSDYQDLASSAPVLSMQLIENAVSRMKQQKPLLPNSSKTHESVKTAAPSASKTKTVFNKTHATSMLLRMQASQSAKSNRSISSRDDSSNMTFDNTIKVFDGNSVLGPQIKQLGLGLKSKKIKAKRTITAGTTKNRDSLSKEKQSILAEKNLRATLQPNLNRKDKKQRRGRGENMINIPMIIHESNNSDRSPSNKSHSGTPTKVKGVNKHGYTSVRSSGKLSLDKGQRQSYTAHPTAQHRALGGKVGSMTDENTVNTTKQQTDLGNIFVPQSNKDYTEEFFKTQPQGFGIDFPYELLMPLQMPSSSNYEPVGVNTLPYLSSMMSKLGNNAPFSTSSNSNLAASVKQDQDNCRIGRRPNTQQISFRPDVLQNQMIEPRLIDERFLSVSKANLIERQIPVNQGNRAYRHPGSAVHRQQLNPTNNSYQRIVTNAGRPQTTKHGNTINVAKKNSAATQSPEPTELTTAIQQPNQSSTLTTIMQNDFISTKVRESLLNMNAGGNAESMKNTESFQVTALGTLALASPKRHENNQKRSQETSNIPLDTSFHKSKVTVTKPAAKDQNAAMALGVRLISSSTGQFGSALSKRPQTSNSLQVLPYQPQPCDEPQKVHESKVTSKQLQQQEDRNSAKSPDTLAYRGMGDEYHENFTLAAYDERQASPLKLRQKLNLSATPGNKHDSNRKLSETRQLKDDPFRNINSNSKGSSSRADLRLQGENKHLHKSAGRGSCQAGNRNSLVSAFERHGSGTPAVGKRLQQSQSKIMITTPIKSNHNRLPRTPSIKSQVVVVNATQHGMSRRTIVPEQQETIPTKDEEGIENLPTIGKDASDSTLEVVGIPGNQTSAQHVLRHKDSEDSQYFRQQSTHKLRLAEHLKSVPSNINDIDEAALLEFETIDKHRRDSSIGKDLLENQNPREQLSTSHEAIDSSSKKRGSGKESKSAEKGQNSLILVEPVDGTPSVKEMMSNSVRATSLQNPGMTATENHFGGKSMLQTLMDFNRVANMNSQVLSATSKNQRQVGFMGNDPIVQANMSTLANVQKLFVSNKDFMEQQKKQIIWLKKQQDGLFQTQTKGVITRRTFNIEQLNQHSNL